MESISNAQYRPGAKVAICTFNRSTEKFPAILHFVQLNCGPWHQQPGDMPWWGSSDWAGTQGRREVSGLSQGLETSQTKNILSVRTEKFYSEHQEESKVKLKWRDWHQNSGYLCCQNSGWIGFTLTFPEAVLPINSSRKCTNQPFWHSSLAH